MTCPDAMPSWTRDPVELAWFYQREGGLTPWAVASAMDIPLEAAVRLLAEACHRRGLVPPLVLIPAARRAA